MKVILLSLPNEGAVIFESILAKILKNIIDDQVTLI